VEKIGEFIASVCISFLVFTSSSYFFINTIGKEEALTSTRYGFVYEAINHIDDDGSPSVVGIGSSMLEQAFDGNCMSERNTGEITFYNLGMAASRPYTDMMMIPRLASSSVDVVMIEVGVNLLFKMDYEKEKLPEDPDSYVEMRFRIGTMMQEERDIGGWIDIVIPEHKEWLNLDVIERSQSLQEYTRIGLENQLLSYTEKVFDFGINSRNIPSPDSKDFDAYLRSPKWPGGGIDDMTNEELNDYNKSLENRSNYTPYSNGTANHAALFYEVETLLEAGKKVVIVTMPHYPVVYEHLKPGQWDGFNATLRDLGAYDVEFLNYTFDNSWQYYHFRDRNHLGADGREEFCNRVAPFIEDLLVV